MKKVRAKFFCDSAIQQFDDTGKIYEEQVYLSPVYSDDKTSENYTFWQATPIGEIRMTINNPGVFGHFQAGKEYYVDFLIVD